MVYTLYTRNFIPIRILFVTFSILWVNVKQTLGRFPCRENVEIHYHTPRPPLPAATFQTHRCFPKCRDMIWRKSSHKLEQLRMGKKLEGNQPFSCTAVLLLRHLVKLRPRHIFLHSMPGWMHQGPLQCLKRGQTNCCKPHLAFRSQYTDLPQSSVLETMISDGSYS